MNQDDDVFPLSHWESLGYDQEHAVALGILQISLTREASALKRMGQTSTIEAVPTDSHIGTDDSDLPDGPLLPDDSLLPLWKEFSETLRLLPSNERGLVNIGIANIQLPKAVLDILEPALKAAPLHRLTLMNNNRLASDGIKLLTRILEVNPTIRSLVLCKNEIDCGVEMLSLLEVARNHPRLEACQLKNCGISSLLQISSEIAPPLFSLQTVSLVGNQLGSHAASLISNCLATNPQNMILDLDDNLLNDEDAALIANSLKTNTNLVRLMLCGNNFTNVGIKTLCKSVYDDQSLNAIKDSNHTCELKLFAANEQIPYGIDEAVFPINGKLFGVDDFPESFVRRCFSAANGDENFVEMLRIEGHMKIKMLHALEGGSTGQFNMKYLNDLSVKLMPKVFAFVQESGKISGTEDKSLDRLFEVLRSQPGVASFHGVIEERGAQQKQPKKRRLG